MSGSNFLALQNSTLSISGFPTNVLTLELNLELTEKLGTDKYIKIQIRARSYNNLQ